MTPRVDRRFAIFLPLALIAGCASPRRRLFSGTPVLRPVDAKAAAAAISAYRRRRGLGAVRPDQILTTAAEQQARAVAAAGDLSHGDFAGRMERLGQDAAWENLALGPTTIAGVIQLWRESPGHDRNLLMRDATRIGIARVDAEAPYWALVLAR